MNKKVKSILYGIVIILVAIALIASKLGFLTVPVISWLSGVSIWGILLSIAMILIIIDGITRIDFFAILVPLAIIGIVFEEPLGIEAITPWTILIVAILLSIGLHLIFPNAGKKKVSVTCNFSDDGEDEDKDCFSYKERGSVAGGEDSKDIVESVRMGAVTKFIYSKNLETVDLNVRTGNMDVYFTDAKVPSGNVDVHVDIKAGNADLYIPKEWKLVNSVSTVAGNVESIGFEKAEEGAPTMNLRGEVNLGNLEIHRV